MKKLLLALILTAAAFAADDWSAPVEVQHDLQPVVTYRARLDGDFLVVQAALQNGWHTFTTDNERRAAEKLAGKPSLGIDQPTQFKLSGALEVAGPWYQSPPQDFSKPEIRWYSWGFEREATFAVKVRRITAGPAKIAIRGQACTETTCKNIDTSLTLNVTATSSSSSHLNLTKLVQSRDREGAVSTTGR
jgi:hypothetical protein